MLQKPIRLLRLPEVCARTGWSEATVRRKVKAGILKPPVHPGDGHVAGFPEPEIEAVIDAAIAARDAGIGHPSAGQIAAASRLGAEARRNKAARRKRAATPS